MKKLIISLFTVLLMFNSQAFASNIEILPTMQTKTNVQDRVWVGTFQIVWNDLMDKFIHGDVKFIGGSPYYVTELNKQEFTVDDISSKSFYKYCGKVKANTKRTIEKAIKKKFNEKSDILDALNLTPDKKRFLIYAMLKKDFQFLNAFDKLGKSSFRDGEAEYFGVNNASGEELRETVKVLFYNSPSDFAVALQTKDNEEVFLYKTPNTKTFNFIYQDMMKKANAYEGEKEFGEADLLKVPNLKFDEEKSFKELTGKRIKGTELVIEEALETVKFEMNNEGVKLKSEAAISLMKCSMPIAEPRRFYLDDTFVLFLKETDKRTPYFALRVHDITKFQ